MRIKELLGLAETLLRDFAITDEMIRISQNKYRTRNYTPEEYEARAEVFLSAISP